jgi:hypothetical protein
MMEEDGVGFPPARIREALIAAQGEWELTVDECDKVSVVRILKPMLELDSRGAMELWRKLPGVVYVGTKREVEWLRGALVEGGFECRASRR